MTGISWRRLRLVALITILLASGGTALYLALLVQRSAEGMTRYVRVDVWAVQQSEYELQQFRAVFAQHIAGDENVPMTSVRKRLAQARSSLLLLERGPDYDQFRLMVDIDGAAALTTAALNKVERALSNRHDFREDLETLQWVETLLATPNATLRQLAFDLSHIRLELQDSDLQNTRWLIGVNRWMLIGFLAATLLFILFLLREAHAARRAEGVARKSEQHTRYLAEHDALTGLPNRMFFRQQLEDCLAHAGRESSQVALHTLDLDGFKDVNDSFGHGFGDKLLVAVAERLSGELGEQEVLVRLGGDEFALIQTSEQGELDWEATARRLSAALSRPFACHGRDIQIGTSIGVARFPIDGQDPDFLLKAADLALYAAKETRGGVELFQKDMITQLEQRKYLEEALRQALSQDALEVYFQPQVTLEEGRCIGAEALVRWHDDELGWVSPADFIPIAEESGLILPLGRWVLETACREALQWEGDAAEAVVAVNVSPQQFIYEDLVEEVCEVLKATGLPPGRLELEITEGLLMRDEQKAIAALESLSDLGVQLAIDDFGTGYSSLSYLKRFSVQKLKIDQSFVREMERDPDDQMIVRTIIDLADGLGMTTIAEGIETEAQMYLLGELGCEEGQGYFFGRPVPAAKFRRFALSCQTPEHQSAPLCLAQAV